MHVHPDILTSTTCDTRSGSGNPFPSISPPIEPTPARDGDVIVASAGGSAPATSSPR
jgi:hypothetical protein